MDSTFSPHPPSATQFFSIPTSSSTSTCQYEAPIHTQYIPAAPHFLSSSLEHKSNHHTDSENAHLNADTNWNPSEQILGGPVYSLAGVNFHQRPPPAVLASHIPVQISPPYDNKPAKGYNPHLSRAPPPNFLSSNANLGCSSGQEAQSPQDSNLFAMSSTRAPRSRNKFDSATSAMPSHQNVESDIHKIEIKTKFPVARIKRIMQADEEVGKVAQVTPVAVSKALELFMIALVSGAADQAREKGSKKVSAQHLKMVVESQPERFDFLAEIVGKVGNSAENASNDCQRTGRKRKEESESMSEDERDKEKARKKGRGRRKKLDE